MNPTEKENEIIADMLKMISLHAAGTDLRTTMIEQYRSFVSAIACRRNIQPFP